jgi:hypothetical protein
VFYFFVFDFLSSGLATHKIKKEGRSKPIS